MIAPRKLIALAAAALALALPAQAWGPRADSAIVTSAAQLLAKDGLLQIQRVEADLRAGALASQADLERMFPALAGSAISAIETEMLLLRAIKENQIDGYFAYRLGALGKLVANVSAPMTQADTSMSNLYYADVENQIDKTSLIAAPHQDVEAAPYFERRILEANVNTDMIVADYRAGLGFNGVAKSLLQQDASRSAAAVADVWRTVLRGKAAVNISTQQREAYILEAFRYYITKGDKPQIAAAARRLDEAHDASPDLLIQVGDLFYDAAMREDAVRRYETALAQAPQRRDVAERIAEYYMDLGAEALEARRLEDAAKAFEDALAASPLHPTAEGRRLEVVAMIEDRDARLNASRAAIESAAGFESLAEQEVLANHIAEAVALMHQAKAEYSRVDEEFPLEYNKAISGMRSIDARLDTLRISLFENAQLLSGSGFGLDPARLAAEAGKALDESAFRAMLKEAYDASKTRLEADSQDLLKIE